MSKAELGSSACPYSVRPGRELGQNGWLEITGETRKRWRGDFHIYEMQQDGKEHRKHKTLILGIRSEPTRKDKPPGLHSHPLDLFLEARSLCTQKCELNWLTTGYWL